MFGQQNNQDDNQIPASSIDAAMGDQPSGAPPAAPSDWQHPDTSSTDAAPAPASAGETVIEPTASAVPTSDAADTPVTNPASSSTPHDLADIKQQALSQLSPLVGHLDQSPEEKFRTTMMMIQASDDQSLIQTAYEAAQQITDEKAKAQALLDIVNEINYFTQQQNH